ncbi:sodium transporter HKT1 isoform X1 [Ziziphus jujuba]|uniref:Sodium transporter HKT1 isoform X1 n=1 Tax=Ziziphus jujuba TaxID=326968 RepID=A0ABM3IH69_ZIZJJ|nr:sodium transporter HKT1 isoform X1 [Ziziphus jujuba]
MCHFNSTHYPSIFVFSFVRKREIKMNINNLDTSLICSNDLESSISCNKIARLRQSIKGLISLFFRLLVFELNPFWIQLAYFVILSFFGYVALKITKPRTSLKPKDLDLFFTSVSSTTVSSMGTVEMEVFSNTQLVIITILMLTGGEVFVSMLGIQLSRFKLTKSSGGYQRIKDENLDEIQDENEDSTPKDRSTEYNSIKCLGYVVFGYLLVVHKLGYILVTMYTTLVPSANRVLKNKAIEIPTFAAFTTVSTFANCGFVPTNENMIVFKKNSGLLLILIPQILLGNTLYPSCLRFSIWLLWKTTKRIEFDYMLRNYEEMGYSSLLSAVHSSLLAVTVFGFMLVQFVLFCALEWNSEIMDGLNPYQKFMASLFEITNSRHTGESVFDLSTITSAILVLFVVMMYLPPHTSFFSTKDQKLSKNRKQNHYATGWKTFVECKVFSPLSYIVIFVILICLTERAKMKKDPLNFNVLNIVIEVVSAYGNVGFSTGYSCKRQLEPESDCIDKWYGFVGRWSAKGKSILILVMFFGRLKKFTLQGGKAWVLS